MPANEFLTKGYYSNCRCNHCCNMRQIESILSAPGPCSLLPLNEAVRIANDHVSRDIAIENQLPELSIDDVSGREEAGGSG